MRFADKEGGLVTNDCTRPDPEPGPKGILMLAYRHIKWGLVLKLFMGAFSWRTWSQGTLKLDSILSLFKCAKIHCDVVAG